MRMNWKPGSIYSSGVGAGDWFHAHYNTGPGPARMLALKGNQRSRGSVVGFESVRDGGNVIQYADEDPEIRRLFKEECRRNGVEFTMEPVVYRTDPFRFSDL